MANDVSSRTWFIDTAGALVIWQPQVYIKFIEVVGGAAAGVVGALMADIQDRNGKSIVRAQFQTAAAGEVQTYNLENWFEGLIVATLGAGPTTLRIHVK
jgi:hypothetical protein